MKIKIPAVILFFILFLILVFFLDNIKLSLLTKRFVKDPYSTLRSLDEGWNIFFFSDDFNTLNLNGSIHPYILENWQEVVDNHNLVMDISISRDLTKFAFLSYNLEERVKQVSILDKTGALISQFSIDRRADHVEFSPNGKLLMITITGASYQGEKQARTISIYSIFENTTEDFNLDTGDNDFTLYKPQWSSNSEIYFSAYANVYKLNISTRKRERTHSNAYSPTISEEGNFIAYHETSYNQIAVESLNENKKYRINLEKINGNVGRIFFSPNEKLLLITFSRGSGSGLGDGGSYVRDIYIYELDTEKLVRIVKGDKSQGGFIYWIEK